MERFELARRIIITDVECQADHELQFYMFGSARSPARICMKHPHSDLSISDPVDESVRSLLLYLIPQLQSIHFVTLEKSTNAYGITPLLRT